MNGSGEDALPHRANEAHYPIFLTVCRRWFANDRHTCARHLGKDSRGRIVPTHQQELIALSKAIPVIEMLELLELQFKHQAGKGF